MSDRNDSVSSYDYELPGELIAARPLGRRDAARLLVVDRPAARLEHRTIADLPELLRAGDCLVLNDTRVIPARVFGRRTATGGKWQGLFLGVTAEGQWRLIGQTRGRLRPGESITLTRSRPPAAARGPTGAACENGPARQAGPAEEFELRLVTCDAEGVWTAEPRDEGDPLDVLARLGTVPLPPYLNRPVAAAEDWERYQTVFARRPGAVAAPTAGLHFTPDLLDRCRQAGIGHAFVTLHVGLGTFRPIAVERLDAHRMHAEWAELPRESADLLNATRAAGGRIVAVGTTTVRTLESAARVTTDDCGGPGEALREWRGETDLFIRPPWRFRAVDGLLTNFHLPRSTLLVLVSAFAGRDLIRRAYAAAIKERYRFYSYGDAMLIT